MNAHKNLLVSFGGFYLPSIAYTTNLRTILSIKLFKGDIGI